MSTGVWKADGDGRESDLDEEALVRAMRRGEAAAFHTFVDRFHRVLVAYGRRLRLRDDERNELAYEVLDDVALELVASTTAPPRGLKLYLVAAFRHRFLNRWRAALRRSNAVREGAEHANEGPDDHDERSAAGASQDLLRASRGPDWEDASLSPILERLSTMLDEGLTSEERQLLVAISENVPQREIAEWLGVSHAAARKRLERLRVRLADAAARYAGSLDAEDARELERFFRRCAARPPQRPRDVPVVSRTSDRQFERENDHE